MYVTWPCLAHSKLEINIPKFKMEQSYSLHTLLPEMGMASVFSNSANLTKLSKDEGLKASEVSFQFQHNIKMCTFQPVQKIIYIFCKITGAAQGYDRGGWDWDHCRSCHNIWHYSIFLTHDLHCQQTILLLHIPWRHKLYAVHGQGDWPHKKLAVMSVQFWSDGTWQCVYSGF